MVRYSEPQNAIRGGGRACAAARAAVISVVYDPSPSLHVSAHAKASGHTVIRRFEPGDGWFDDYETDGGMDAPVLAPPEHHPSSSRRRQVLQARCRATGSATCTTGDAGRNRHEAHHLSAALQVPG